MAMVAILLKWPSRSEQTFIPPTHWGAIWNLAFTDQVVFEEKTFEEFPYMNLCKTSGPWGGAIFGSRAIILLETGKIKLHTKYQKAGPSSFIQDF